MEVTGGCTGGYWSWWWLRGGCSRGREWAQAFWDRQGVLTHEEGDAGVPVRDLRRGTHKHTKYKSGANRQR